MHASPNNLPLRELRNQIALDVYLQSTDPRKHPSAAQLKNYALTAFLAADAFISTLERQAPKPEAPDNPNAGPTEVRPTVAPIAGKAFYMRNGDTVRIVSTPLLRTPFRGFWNHRWVYYRPCGRNESNPQYDLIDECPF